MTGTTLRSARLRVFGSPLFLIIAIASLLVFGASSARSADRTFTLAVKLRATSKSNLLATVRVKGPARATCSLDVRVGAAQQRLPRLTADKQGVAGWQWLIPPSAPSGTWRFDVVCGTGSARREMVRSVAVITPALSGGGPLGVADSLTTPKGQIAGLGGDGNPFPWHQCTWLAWEKRSDIYQSAVAAGIPRAGSRGTSQGVTVYVWDGMMWYLNAQKANLRVGSNPQSNALVSFGPYSGNPYGHVAYVEQVASPTRILVSQCNGFTLACGEQWINPKTFPGGLEGYVYGGANPPAPAPQPAPTPSPAPAPPTPGPTPPAPGTDGTPPSTPSNLSVSGVTTTALQLNWTASTDNVGVAGYSVFLNGTKVGSVSDLYGNLIGLACGTAYTLGVAAYDSVGNTSSIATTTAATAACPPQPQTFHIEDDFLGGTWARTDPNDGTWYSRGSAPPNGAYWYPNGLAVAVDCARSAASYVVRYADGHSETWNTWFHVTDGKWYPSAATQEVFNNSFYGLPAC